MHEKTMMKYWRKAVLWVNKNTCIICGLKQPSDMLECHHVVPRRNVFLRYDWRNGVCVCVGHCHRAAHTKKGERLLSAKHPHYDYLLEHENIRIKDWLVKTGQTRDEFQEGELVELRAVMGR